MNAKKLHHVNASPPIVIANSVPKSGTYLLQRLIASLKGFGESKHHLQDQRCYLTEENQYYRSVFLCDYRKLIENAAPGEVFAAHLQSSDESHAFFASNSQNVKHLLIYRHPLDILVSNTLFYSKSETMKRDYYSAKVRRYYLEAFDNDADRMLEILHSNPTFNYYLKYLGWLNDPNVLTVRFEDLYTALLSRESTGVLSEICDFVGADPCAVDWNELALAMLETGPTASGAKKKIGQYLDHFDQRHWNCILDTDLLDILSKFDYEIEGWNPTLSLFGASAGGEKALREVLPPNRVHKLYDNDPDKWGNRLSDLTVTPPSEIVPEDQEHFLICSVHSESIASQLFKMGIPDERIHLWTGIHRY